jgi:hypothetical protein
VVEFPPDYSWLHPGHSPLRIDPDPLHGRKVDP